MPVSFDVDSVGRVDPAPVPGFRVGISARGDGCTGCLLDDGRVVHTVELDNPDVALLLGQLIDGLDGRVSSVSVDLSELLADALTGPVPAADPVVMVRIVPRAALDPTLAGNPAPVVERLVAHRFSVGGGHDLYGRELRRLDRAAAVALCGRPEIVGAAGIAVLATGSMAQSRHERAVADLLQAAAPDAHISVAGDFGGLGLAAREATAVLDAALSTVAGPLADRLVDAVDRCSPGALLLIARGDGGLCNEAALRSHPVVALDAAAALQLLGAAHLAGYADCRVVVPGRDAGPPMIGEVRNGLVSAQPFVHTALGAELVIPTATLSPFAGVPDEPADPDGDTGTPLVFADHDINRLAAVGAAVSRPTAWLDEIAIIESTAELDTVRRDAGERATAIATANGAAPGTAGIVEMSTVAVPYSPAGTVRVRVRVAGLADSSRLVPR